MRSFENIIRPIGEALASIEGLKVFHYWRPQIQAPFCVWTEDDGRSFEADNRKAEFWMTGSVSYYTKTEFDGMADAINEALDGVAAWTYDGATYEEETGLIHHEWSWSR